MTQTKFFRWTLLLCLSGATSPLAAQGVGEKAKKVEQMQVLKTDGKVLRITVDGKEQQIPWVINPSLRPDVFETSGEEVVFRYIIIGMYSLRPFHSSRHRELVASGGTYMDCPRFGIAYTGIHPYLPALNRKRAGGLCFAAFVSPISLLHPCIFGFVND